MKEAAQERRGPGQKKLFEETESEWVEVDTSRVRVERCRDFGGPWLGLELARKLGLNEFLDKTIRSGREEIPWGVMVLALVIARLCNPSSELHIAEHYYEQSGLSDLLGVPAEKVNDDRVYRALDAVLPHKDALEVFLKSRLGTLFDIEYDLLLYTTNVRKLVFCASFLSCAFSKSLQCNGLSCRQTGANFTDVVHADSAIRNPKSAFGCGHRPRYDVTSTYFEGKAERNRLAQRGYSRDRRPDCKQVCIGLVVSKCGMPLGYEVFAGNRSDVTTLREVVETMEKRYGQADRIWVLDRGMISERNIGFLKGGGRRYIAGTPRTMLKSFEKELLKEDWQSVRAGLEVKLCPSPKGEEVFILCRSRERREKEKAMHVRFEKRIEEGLEKIAKSCGKRKYKVATIGKRLGRLLQRNSRAGRLFDTDVVEGSDSRAKLVWNKQKAWRDWASLSEGCYLLRSNVTEWTAEDLWKAYIQLTEAEAAFRIQKSDLRIRPIWHQKAERVQGHILVCFLAYVLSKTLSQLCRRAGLGSEPRRVFEELSKIKVVDVVLPTRKGIDIRRRCVTQPTDHQAILLQRLGLHLPARIKMTEM